MSPGVLCRALDQSVRVQLDVSWGVVGWGFTLLDTMQGQIDDCRAREFSYGVLRTLMHNAPEEAIETSPFPPFEVLIRNVRTNYNKIYLQLRARSAGGYGSIYRRSGLSGGSSDNSPTKPGSRAMNINRQQ